MSWNMDAQDLQTLEMTVEQTQTEPTVPIPPDMEPHDAQMRETVVEEMQTESPPSDINPVVEQMQTDNTPQGMEHGDIRQLKTDLEEMQADTPYPGTPARSEYFPEEAVSDDGTITEEATSDDEDDTPQITPIPRAPPGKVYKKPFIPTHRLSPKEITDIRFKNTKEEIGTMDRYLRSVVYKIQRDPQKPIDWPGLQRLADKANGLLRFIEFLGVADNKYTDGRLYVVYLEHVERMATGLAQSSSAEDKMDYAQEAYFTLGFNKVEELGARERWLSMFRDDSY
ncbi:hypothetical protein V8F20_009585 [Naviculisporaceae sp. PSN 640]